MGELKWICPKCGSEETVILRPVKTLNGSLEFIHGGEIIHATRLITKRTMLFYCTVCGKYKITSTQTYVEECAKAMKQEKERGKLTTSNIIIGVALGVVIGSIICYMIITAIFF